MNNMAVVVVFLVCPAVLAKLVSEQSDLTGLPDKGEKSDLRPGEYDGSQGLENLKDKVDRQQLLVVVLSRQGV
jgi:hypothetical protein